MGSFLLNKEQIAIIKKDFNAKKINDKETIQIIKNFSKEYNFVIDPHTATAFKSAEINSAGEEMLILGTAHPCKFSETVHQATGIEPKIPENIKNILNKKESYITLDNNLSAIKNYILERIKEI